MTGGHSASWDVVMKWLPAAASGCSATVGIRVGDAGP